MNQPSIKKNIILSTIYQFLVLAIPFVTLPYVSRVLQADGIGIASYTMSVQSYFSLFAVLGATSYGTREIACVRDDKGKRSKLFCEIESLIVGITTIVLFFWCIFVYLNREYQLLYLILTVNIIAVIFDISWFYAGLEKFQLIVTRNSVVKVVVTVGIFLLIKEKSDLWLYLLLMSVGTLLGNLSMWLMLKQYVHFFSISFAALVKHFREAIVYFVPTIATSVYTVFSKILLGLLVGDAYENGYYEQATRIISVLQTLTFAALNQVMMSRMSYLFAGDKLSEIKRRLVWSIQYIFFMGFGMCFGLIAVAPNFIPLFLGPGYDNVVFLLQILSPIVLIIAVSNVLGSQYYTPAGLRALSARFIVIGALCNLVLNLLLIPRLHSIGAVVASLIAEGVITVLYFCNCDNYLTLKLLISCAWRKIIAAVIMMIIVLQVPKIGMSDINCLLVQIISGGTMYLLILVLLRDEFLKYVVRMVSHGKA